MEIDLMILNTLAVLVNTYVMLLCSVKNPRD